MLARCGMVQVQVQRVIISPKVNTKAIPPQANINLFIIKFWLYLLLPFMEHRSQLINKLMSACSGMA